MTVTLTSPVMGLAVGAPYTGALESWLLHEGYARADTDSLTDAIPVTPTAAVLTGGTNAAATVGTNGNIVFGTKGGVRTTVALLAADTAAGAATKIDTALNSLADAVINASKLQVTSVATGETAYVTVVDGTAAVLAALGVTLGQVAYGGDGRPTGSSNTGVQADTPANDPTAAKNREAPYFPSTPDLQANIANDAAHLTLPTNPAPRSGSFDMDVNDVDAEQPSSLRVSPDELPLAGGELTIFGDNLKGVTGVTVGGTAATNLDASVADDGVITVTAPAKVAGTYAVAVTDNVGTTTLSNAVTYA